MPEQACNPLVLRLIGESPKKIIGMLFNWHYNAAR